MWCHTEELQTRMTLIHTLENRLAALSKQHDAEMERNTQKVHTCIHILERCKYTDSYTERQI